MRSISGWPSGLLWIHSLSVGVDEYPHWIFEAPLVTCGRGELVDLGALRGALESGHLSGAALDVLDTEPPPPGHPALALPRTILTPHLAWLSAESEFASYEQAAAAIAAVLAGQAPRHAVRQ